MTDVARFFHAACVRCALTALLLCPAASARLFVSPAQTSARPQAAGVSDAAGRPLAIEDYYAIKSVGNPAISPDGHWVAFTVGTRVEDTNGNTSEVWLVAADGSSPARRVSPENADASSPQWADDNHLRFSSGGRAYLLDPGAPD